MTSFAFNPLTVALAGVGCIFVASMLMPPDVWDRFKDWLRRAPTDGEIIPPVLPPQTWPWEKDHTE